MKKLLAFMALMAMLFSANCSRIESNNDPIIGIWSETYTSTGASTFKSSIRKEWIFNDVYLGRYQELSNNQITLKTDFKWSHENGSYTVEYRALENKANDVFIIKTSDNGTFLQLINGDLLAIKD